MISQVLSLGMRDDLQNHLNFILQMFNLSFESGDGESNKTGYCLLSGMTALDEIGINFVIPLILYGELVLLYFIRRNKTFFNRDANYHYAFWNLNFIIVGIFITNCIKLIACRSVSGHSVVYYAGHFNSISLSI